MNTANLNTIDAWNLSRPLKDPEIGKLPYVCPPKSQGVHLSEPTYRSWLASKVAVMSSSVGEKGCKTWFLSQAEREFYAMWGFLPNEEQLRMVGK